LSLNGHLHKIHRNETLGMKSRKYNWNKGAKEWVNYLTTSRVLKIIRDQHPCFPFYKHESNYYEEPKCKGKGMFFETLKSKIDRQSLENRLDMFRGLYYNRNNGLNDDQIGILLKKTFFVILKIIYLHPNFFPPTNVLNQINIPSVVAL